MKIEKLPFGIDQAFLNTLNTMDTEALKSLVVQLEGQKEEAELIKETPGYIEAKDAYMLVRGPYVDTKKALKNKTKLVMERLKEKGGV